MTESVIVAASEFLMGLWAGWSSWALTKRPMSDTPAGWMTRSDHAWAVAVFDLANVLCAWPSGLLSDRIGRKGCLLVIGVTLSGSFGVLFAPSRWAVFAARSLAGVAKSLALCTTPAFLAEISTNEARGKLNVTVASFDSLGMLVAMTAGPRCPYAVMNGLSFVVALGVLAAVCRVPETPVFLLSRGRPLDARLSREWYLPGDTAELHDEQMDHLRRSVDEDMSSPDTFYELFADGGNLVALALVLGAVVAQRGGGITCVLSYTTTTLPADGPVNPHNVAAAFAVVRLAFTAFAASLIDRYGRRPLLIGSHLSCAAVSAAYAWFLYCAAADDGTGSLSPSVFVGWALCSCVVLFVAVYSLGAGSVPGALLGEMFPTNVKSRAVTVINVVASLCSFTATAAYLRVTDAFGVHVMYVVFCVVNASWAVCAYLYLFETNGVSLSEIQKTLDGYKRPRPAVNT